MNFETLDKGNKRKYILRSIVVITIISMITYIGTRAKYRLTSSTQLANGVINYSPSDLEMIAVKLQNDSNGYDNTETIPSSGYTLNTELSACKVGEEKQEVSITYENGKVGISGITTKGTKCQLYFDKEKLKGKDLILSKNTIDTSRSSGSFTASFEENTAGRIFSALDDDGTTYFFAGSNPNNWVSFAGFYWRIIRINGDKSIRIIFNGPTTDQTAASTQIGTSKFNENQNDNAYVGYMYGVPGSSSYAETHANTHSSTIKTYLDNWYTTNLKENYEKYIDTNAGFCGDRTNQTGDGYGTGYTGYASSERIYLNGWKSDQNSTYLCNQINDLYTVSSSNKGNKALTNPIGLIASDEVIYTGGFGSYNGVKNYWLKTGQAYWTMSPSACNGSTASVIAVYGGGYVTYIQLDRLFGVRPVINLKADALTTGSGTSSDPYRIN